MSRTRLNQFLEDLESITDIESRSDFLIETASRYQPLSESIAPRPYPNKNQIPGCESKVYLFPTQLAQGRVKLNFAVENPHGISAKAMGVILDECLSGAAPEEFAQLDVEILTKIFGSALTMGKDQGLKNLILACKQAAVGKFPN